MKRIIFTFILIAATMQLFSQSTPIYRCFIKYSYDAAGNRTQREYVCATVSDVLTGDTNGDGVIDNDDIQYGGVDDGSGLGARHGSSKATVKSTWNMKVFPNPTNGIFSISFSKTIEKGLLIIYNATGAEILQEPIENTNMLKTKISSYSAGIYMIKVVETKTGIVQWIKLIKEY